MLRKPAAPTASLPPRITGAEWLTRASTQAVLAALTTGGQEARVVGGAVRNQLMGRPVGDIDIATTAMPETVMELAAKAGLASVPTGLAHGTVTVIAAGHPYEVTTLRRDVATDGRHATVAFTDDWAADASRRDFTMNALYCAADGEVFDPLGGTADLSAGRVRFIGDPLQRIREDYLRILRFFRFHAEYGVGAPDPEGLAACVAERSGLARLSAERVRAEVVKLLAAPRALAAVTALFEHGLLLEVLGQVPWPLRLGRLIELETALHRPPDVMLRLSALAIAAEEDGARLADRLRLSNAERARLIVFAPVNPIARDMSETAAKQMLYRLGAEAWPRHVLAAWCVSSGQPSDATWQRFLQLCVQWHVPAMPVRGADVLAAGVPAGPQVGNILAAFEAWWMESGFPIDDQAVRLKLGELVEVASGGREPDVK